MMLLTVSTTSFAQVYNEVIAANDIKTASLEVNRISSSAKDVSECDLQQYGCPTNPYIDDFMRDVFVGYHRVLRRRIAKGGQQPNNQGFLGPAKNMYDLKWDCGFERQAQAAIEQCNAHPRANVSQNIVSFAGRTGPYSNWTNAVWGMIGWLSPASQYGINSQNEVTNVKQLNFGNMAYSKSSKFGCAFKTCGDQFIVTCLYNHVGNRPSTELWEGGEPCRTNGDCTTYGGSTCNNGLCVDSENKGGVTYTRDDKKSEEKKPSGKEKENPNGDKAPNRSKEEEVKKNGGGRDEKKKHTEEEGRKKPSADKADQQKTTKKGNPSDSGVKSTSRKPKENGSGDRSSSTVSMCPGSKITAKARELFLALHNEMRRNIALGKAPNNVGFLGPAKNMYKMDWKCEYEKWAQSTVDSCNSNGDLGPASNGVSIAGNGEEYRSNPYQYINETFQVWADGPQLYGTTNVYENWNNYYFGNFFRGNFQGTVMWEKGPACQRDEDCTTYSGSTCDNGLCVADGASGMAVGGTNKMCPKNSHMNDEAREKFLERHNSLRSSLAKGEQEDPLGVNGFAPKAARMRKMVWDCEIEYNSQKHASSCQYEHSPPSERPGLGQNLYFSEQLTLGVALAAGQASDSWWSELKTFGVPPENRITPAVYYRKGKEIGHYSQMAWQNSYKLGCGISWCPVYTYVVCEYGPGGNTMGELIYQLGSPCSTDEDCQCSGCKCSKEEALCIMP
ncbi:hypothetical protein ANCCAN_17647 [Ancylostoma caninum]|uniref:SCP domain-containing protein n=1 Tax=Ancylostoma caninum TaxID=29170 RepID=A0A368FWH8_ANCCA|nr:hypothetical protein ANCCAN_17647 [Ancylostoma caninum]